MFLAHTFFYQQINQLTCDLLPLGSNMTM